MHNGMLSQQQMQISLQYRPYIHNSFIKTVFNDVEVTEVKKRGRVRGR